MNEKENYDIIDNNDIDGEDKNKFLSEKKDLNNSYNSIDNKTAKDIIDNIPFSKHHFTILALVLSILAVEGTEITFVSYIIIPLRKYMDCTSFELEISASMGYIGLGLGHFFIIFLKRKFDRRTIILYCLVTINIFRIISIFTLNIVFFSIIRFANGVLLGISIPICLNILSEYLPMKNRTLILNSVHGGFYVGNIFLLVIMIIVMPNFEENMIVTILLCVWFLTFVVTIAFIFLLDDSPRNLILNNQVNKGISIYRNILKSYGAVLSNSKKDEIVQFINNSNKHVKEITFSQIYSKKFNNCVILSCLWFGNSLLREGLKLIFTETLKYLNLASNTNIIRNQIYLSLGCLVCIVIFSVISEHKLSLKISMIVCLGISFIFTILGVIFVKHLNIFICFTIAFIVTANTAICTYTQFYYSTIMRDAAFGVFNFYKRLGGVISQFLFMGLLGLNTLIPYYLAASLVGINIFATFFLEDINNDMFDQQKDDDEVILKQESKSLDQ